MNRLGLVILVLVSLWFAVAAQAVVAYQYRTHSEITRQAFEVSEGVNAYLSAVGIAPDDVFVRHTRTRRELLAFFDNKGTPQGWMIEGVIREDDFSVHPPIEVFLGCVAPENPFSSIDRVLNHFLDVQRDGRGMTIGRTLGLPAVDWALGKGGSESVPNRYSLPEARRYQVLSLVARSRHERELNTALFFRTLGHVIHLLQDVAQPQHTRNDAHSGCVPPIGGHASWYEKYVETRALNQKFRSRGTESPLLSLTGYPAPKLPAYEDYWTGHKGLANFSGKNFFSVGTNLDTNCSGLPAPPCRLDTYEKQDEPFESRTVRGQPVTGKVRVFVHSMVDPVTLEPVQAAVTSRSVWDEHLEQDGRPPSFTLNTVNYKSKSDILVPRAVGYSAGLLDRFFRASVGAEVDHDGINIYNATPDEAVAGHFSLLHENPDGIRELLGAFLLTIQAESHARVSIPRKLPADTPPGTRCWLVFQGTVGDEPGVVAGRETSCPIETPPPVQGTEWWVYTCVILRSIPGVPGGAPPVYYTYATQGPPTYPEGDPVAQFNVGFYTTCSRTGSVSWGAAGPPPDIYREHPDV